MFLNFERLSVKTSADVKAIHAEIERRLNAIGHKVYGIVNYDHFDLDPQVETEYAAMVKSLAIVSVGPEAGSALPVSRWR